MVKSLLVKLIWILLTAVFLKGMLFAAIVPMWHTPDEQAHFAQVANIAELGEMPRGQFDLNREILESERLLGTDRDERGNNKFTFHSEYKIDYTDNAIGKFEDQIKSLPRDYRTQMVKYEASNYPPLYYAVSAIPYKIFYESDLISRVFAVRFLSVIIGVVSVYVSWLIGKEIFSEPLYQLVLPVMVGFHPMLSFIGVGVTSDNLFNLLFSLIILVSILIIKNGLALNYVLASTLLVILSYLTKPQFLLVIPILAMATLFSLVVSKSYGKLKIAGLFLLVSVIVAGMTILNVTFRTFLEQFYPQSFYPGIASQTNQVSFYQFIKESLRHTYAEVLPWYWGVFDWLGVTYGRWVHRAINWIIVLAVVGVALKLFQIIHKRTREDYIFIFLIVASLIYFLGIIYYNFLFTLSHGFPFGIQGRYYFPLIVAHMAIILIGLKTLASRWNQVMEPLPKILGLLLIVLNFIALWTIAKSYYDLSSFTTFITQASQYKPWFFKGNWLVMWIILYLISLGLFLKYFLQNSSDIIHLGPFKLRVHRQAD